MQTISDLQAGKAGEYLVCADLILNGHIAFPSEQGLPYDIILACNGKILKVQVKTTRKHRAMPQRKSHTPCYLFYIGCNGKNKRWNNYHKNDVDLFALVALDSKTIAYIPNSKKIKGAMSFRIPEYIGTYGDELSYAIKQKVIELRKTKSIKEVSEILNMSISSVSKYSANFYQPNVDKRSDRYFDTFLLSDALKSLLKKN